MIEEILRIVSASNASDVHLHSGKIPVVRVNGALSPHGCDVIRSESILEFLSLVVPRELCDSFASLREIDSAFSMVGHRWRLHAYHAEHGVGVALRRLPCVVPCLHELGLPEVVQRFIALRQGLVLVTGATGSGKSTTAAAILRLIGDSRACHIVTIEDPIEYLHNSSTCLVSQRQVGAHTGSFSQALRAALREDPDVILVGEMRDLETVRLALQAAETGHLVISTLHTSGAARAVSRVIDVFPPEQQSLVRTILSETVEAIISQELVPSKRGGMALVCEVLVGAPSVRALIRDGKFHQLEHVMQTSAEMGMQTRARSVERLRAAGVVGSE